MANALRTVLVALIVFFCYTQVDAWTSRKTRTRRRKPLSAQAKLEKYATKQFMKYGYYTSWVTNKASLRRAINFFQLFNGLPTTGKLDKAVLDKLKQPRCGISEPIIHQKDDLKPYYLAGSVWKNKRITWYWDGMKESFDEMTGYDIYRALRQAFHMWDGACANIEFAEKKRQPGRIYNINNADITISFTGKHHRCPFPQDGKGESMGHSFYPYGNRGLAGDIHFDDAEKFTLRPTNGTSAVNFLWAATHAIGHSLGLEHSHKRSSMMYPWYNSASPVLRLHQSDIDGIRALYGKKMGCGEESVNTTRRKGTTSTTSTTTTTTTTTMTTRTQPPPPPFPPQTQPPPPPFAPQTQPPPPPFAPKTQPPPPPFASKTQPPPPPFAPKTQPPPPPFAPQTRPPPPPFAPQTQPPPPSFAPQTQPPPPPFAPQTQPPPPFLLTNVTKAETSGIGAEEEEGESKTTNELTLPPTDETLTMSENKT